MASFDSDAMEETPSEQFKRGVEDDWPSVQEVATGWEMWSHISVWSASQATSDDSSWIDVGRTNPTLLKGPSMTMAERLKLGMNGESGAKPPTCGIRQPGPVTRCHLKSIHEDKPGAGGGGGACDYDSADDLDNFSRDSRFHGWKKGAKSSRSVKSQNRVAEAKQKRNAQRMGC